MEYVVVAFYHFAPLEEPEALRDTLHKECLKHHIRGTILLAQEGVNSTIAGPRKGIDAILSHIRAWKGFDSMEHKESYAQKMPFHRMKVKVKPEIVTMGMPGVDPNAAVGKYIEPENWNAFIEDPEVILIDVRNDYELRAGSFKNAINPKTDTFRQFPDYVKKELEAHKDKKIATFCTGGIRCEKATSYMAEQGFDVYHLKGGILKYLENIPQKESTWEGECFVFDQRVTVKHGMEEGSFALCYGCQMPVSLEEQESPHYRKGVSCPHCYDRLTPERKKHLEARQYQVNLAAERGERHIGY